MGKAPLLEIGKIRVAFKCTTSRLSGNFRQLCKNVYSQYCNFVNLGVCLNQRRGKHTDMLSHARDGRISRHPTKCVGIRAATFERTSRPNFLCFVYLLPSLRAGRRFHAQRHSGSASLPATKPHYLHCLCSTALMSLLLASPTANMLRLD